MEDEIREDPIEVARRLVAVQILEADMTGDLEDALREATAEWGEAEWQHAAKGDPATTAQLIQAIQKDLHADEQDRS